MLTREQKESIVAELSEAIKASPASVFVDFKGLPAQDMVALKKELREADSTLQVIKKSLLTIALKNNDVELDPKTLDGQVAVSVSSDEVTAAKILAKFAKGNENVKIIGGVLDGEVLSQEGAIELSKMPSLDELRGTFITYLQSPARNFVGALTAPQSSFVGAMQALAEKKAQEA